MGFGGDVQIIADQKFPRSLEWLLSTNLEKPQNCICLFSIQKKLVSLEGAPSYWQELSNASGAKALEFQGNACYVKSEINPDLPKNGSRAPSDPKNLANSLRQLFIHKFKHFLSW